MKQYKDMKYTKSPFKVARTLLLEFGESMDDLTKMYGVQATMNFAMAEKEEQVEIDSQLDMDADLAQGWRKLILHILQSALYGAENQEEALAEVFQAIKDMQTVKERMSWTNGNLEVWEMMEIMTRNG